MARPRPLLSPLLPLGLLTLGALLAGGVEGTPWRASCPPGHRLDPNRATAARLALLPGLGPARAAALVAERHRGGPYRSLADLARRVRGVGPVLVARWRPHLRLR